MQAQQLMIALISPSMIRHPHIEVTITPHKEAQRSTYFSGHRSSSKSFTLVHYNHTPSTIFISCTLFSPPIFIKVSIGWSPGLINNAFADGTEVLRNFKSCAHCIPGTPHRTKNGIRSLLLQTQPAINPKQKPNKNDGIKTMNVAMGAQIQSLISNGFFSKI